MSIHPQLEADCHRLGELVSGTLLLHRNAALPWFILVPTTDTTDLLDLAPGQLAAVMADSQAVSGFIKQTLGYHKVNFAGLGNVVPQLHLHIIGREEGDACWPKPVWGHLEAEQEYPATTLADWQQQLANTVGLQVV